MTKYPIETDGYTHVTLGSLNDGILGTVFLNMSGFIVQIRRLKCGMGMISNKDEQNVTYEILKKPLKNKKTYISRHFVLFRVNHPITPRYSRSLSFC